MQHIYWMMEWRLTLSIANIKLFVAGDTDADDMRPLRLGGSEVECVTEDLITARRLRCWVMWQEWMKAGFPRGCCLVGCLSKDLPMVPR